ncbi:MAG: ATP-binding protein, partial [Tepidiformaceae bacterium]
PCGTRPHVAVGLHELTGEVALSVEDDGEGMPLDRRDLVFERFTRLDSSRALRGAAGRGLASRLRAQSWNRTAGRSRWRLPPEGGAKFVIRLPAPTSRQTVTDS